MALLASTVVAVIFVVFGRTFERVITVLAFFFVANYALSFVSVFVLRSREPEKPRPYRAWAIRDDGARPGGLDCVSDWGDRE
jgi:amino acid transporter